MLACMNCWLTLCADPIQYACMYTLYVREMHSIYMAFIKGHNLKHLLRLNMLDFPSMLGENCLLLIEFTHKVTCLLQVWRTRVQVTQNLMAALIYYLPSRSRGMRLSGGGGGFGGRSRGSDNPVSFSVELPLLVAVTNTLTFST